VLRRTKIVATLGPASDSPERIGALLEAGVDVVRLNLSHGTVEEHLHRLALVRDMSVASQRTVAVLADLPGPKVRSGEFPDGGSFLAEGDAVKLVPGDGPSSHHLIHVEYPTLLDDLDVGDRVVLGDGAIQLVVTGRESTPTAGVVHTRVVTGGRAQGRPGVHIPAERLRLTAPTEHDLALAAAMGAAGVDFLAVSFVRSADDIRRVREVVARSGVQLVAKIETAPAIAAIDDICEAADVVMVARGDLGIECPLEDLPHLQKRVIRHCVEAGVPVITATQMLESMIQSPSPTRAEVTDVANAVFDGTDALMLSAETAIGHDPALVVRTMAGIAARAEREAQYSQWGTRLGRVQRRYWPSGPSRITLAVTHAAWQAAMDLEVAAILCCTRSGRTVRAMSRFRPEARLVGLSPDPVTVRQMAVSWGVVPLQVDTYASTDELVWFAVERALQAGIIVHGDTVVVLAGAPDRPSAATDVLRVVHVD
jgi:pyruvate kinase